MYVLVDCNSFYASFERIFNPCLSHQPMAVLSHSDGCVMASNRVLPGAVNGSLTKFRGALQIVRSLFKRGIKHLWTGVIISGTGVINHQPLIRIIGKWNMKYRDSTIKLWNQDLKRILKMLQERLTPGYNTHNDFITVKCK